MSSGCGSDSSREAYDVKTGACGGESGGGSSCGSCQACGTSCGGNPVECALAMWGQSFFQAMKAVQVEIMKAKIQKAWGQKMDKAADAVLEAMGAKWQSMLAEAKVKAEVREKLQGLWQESQK